MNRFAVAASLAFASLFATAASAATTIVNPTATRTVALSSTLAPDIVGQTFVPTEGLLTGLAFRFGTLTAVRTGTVTLSLYDSAVAPGDPLPARALYTNTVGLDGLIARGVGDFVELLNSNIAVRSGATYTAVLTGTSNVAIAFGTGEGYVPGYLLQTTVNDSTCRDTFRACDASFRFSTGPAGAAVPEPASWAMMIAGVGLVGGAARRRRTVRVAFG